ncbi:MULTISPECIES: YheU family protein [Tatumella]|mgnify:CR=1 FL=1|uniref:UPF0270 protein GTPT_0399 n=3 Tax=Tatumella TaxID=82986 RepID=A0A085JP30_9GAMM|nr:MULTISPECIES: YheU family protein [Tatumella]KFD22226.1 putative cytoplasmic protein [Tatumella ptyseos ATCC 33301]MBS0909300.1 YheU family protein [Tatumella sp. JGM118]SQK71701.1 Uncharacterised protein family (UPF0270) [Tatumella ptyseos]
MIIPWQQLNPETLNNLIESFVLREGTDYGEEERTLEEKTQDIHRQLTAGEIVVVWSELNESVSLMQASTFRQNR